MYNVDHHFEIGSTHTDIPCQDYSYSGIINGVTYGIILDGCSSAKDSDVGARLLHLSVKNTLEKNHIPNVMTLDAEEFSRLVLQQLKYCVGILDVPEETLYATMIIVLNKDDKFRVIAFGDGVIVVRTKDRIKQINFKYTNNAPNYIAYSLSKELYARYATFAKDSKLIISEKEYDSNTGLIVFNSEIENTFDIEYRPIYEFIDIEQISIYSDGFETFRYSNKHPTNKCSAIKDEVVLEKYFTSKNPHGSFIKRSFQFNCRANNNAFIEHQDDFSCVSFIKVIEDGK